MNENNSTSSVDISPTYTVGSVGEVNRLQDKPLSAEEKKMTRELHEQRNYLNNVCKIALRHAADSRRRYDYEWMVRDLFRRGYQFSRYQPTTQTVILAARQTARIPVNITAAQMRSIRNQVTSFRPKYETMPKHQTEESRVQARYTQQLLDYYFDHLNFKKKIKETVTQGLMYSIGGPWQIVYDEDTDEIKVWLLDPFDFFFDPLAEELSECEYVIKAVRRPLGEIINNHEYSLLSRKEVTGGEARLAVSEYKQFMIQALKYVTQYNRDESPTAIQFEGYFRIYDEDTGKPHLRRVDWTDQNSTPLLYEDLKTNEYDFEVYHADLNPKEILGESWMKHVMPLNRVLNSLESSVFDYNYRVAKGRIVVDRDSGVRAIHNTHGEIISKNKGAEVRALDMPALPVATSAQIERMNRYIEDVGGAHDASMGRIPTGIKSGVGLGELKQADATNQNDLVDNLEDFLEGVGRKILKKIAENQSKIKVIQALGYRESEAKYFAVVGQSANMKGKTDEKHKGQVKIGPDWLDLAIIGDDNNVRVTIGSWLGYTKEMREEKVIKYAQLKLIDQKTALSLLEFGDIENIVNRTRLEAMFSSRLHQQTPAGGPPIVDPNVENDMMILEGKDVPVDFHDDHFIHYAIHQQALGRGRDDLVEKHMAQHLIYMEQPSPSSDNVGQQGVSSDQGGQPPPDMMRNQQVAGQQTPSNGMGGKMPLPS